METWVQVLLGAGGLLTPVVIGAMARDRALLTMMKQNSDAVHDRVNRVRDEYVRRDDLDGHLKRWEKQIDDLRGDLRRSSEKTDKRLDAILERLEGRGGQQ